MKFRVKSYDGVIEDFNTEGEARVFFNQKKEELKAAKVADVIVPSVHIHRCYHDEIPARACEIIEVFKSSKKLKV